MSTLLPRITRAEAANLIELARSTPVPALAALMPFTDVRARFSPIGGTRASHQRLAEIRRAVVELAVSHGYPGGSGASTFDAPAGVLLRDCLDITAHEAASADVWTHLTCCWLMDVAVWRFGAAADARRFIGDVNRNTFRRLWWRATVLGGDSGADRNLAALQEDELVNLMERPTLARDGRLVRCMVDRFLKCLDSGPGVRREDLMRDLAKRVLRLTPFTDLQGIGDDALAAIIDGQLARSLAALRGDLQPPEARIRDTGRAGPREPWTQRSTATSPPSPASPTDVHATALALAMQPGGATNAKLREQHPGLSSVAATGVLQALVTEGRLVRRGEKRGTHYVPRNEH